MNTVPDMTVATRKVGAEDIIMMRLPGGRPSDVQARSRRRLAEASKMKQFVGLWLC